VRTLIYLSVPYSSADGSVRGERMAAAVAAMRLLMAEGRLVVCPVTMNHAALESEDGPPPRVGGGYWRDLETKLASACDELFILTAGGWLESRGVARERSLFETAGKPIYFLQPGAPVSSARPSNECG
jgi:hypothetical protein